MWSFLKEMKIGSASKLKCLCSRFDEEKRVWGILIGQKGCELRVNWEKLKAFVQVPFSVPFLQR